jgi:transcriptional regulator with XRE-family HTH domain
MKALGGNLRRARKAGGVTQEAAALALGTDPSYYAKIERGEVNVTIGMLVAICRFFGWALPHPLRDEAPQ